MIRKLMRNVQRKIAGTRATMSGPAVGSGRLQRAGMHQAAEHEYQRARMAEGVPEPETVEEGLEMPAELDEDSTIEDLYSAIPSYTISADVFVRNNEALSESSFDDLIAASEQKLCDTGKSFILNVFVVDPSAFDSLSREDLSSVMDTYNKTLEPDGAIVLNTAEVMVFLGKVD